MLLPLWVILTFAILGLVIVGLLWRMKNCRCSLYETFESAEPEDAEQTESAEPEDAEQTKSAKPEGAEQTESAKPEDAEQTESAESEETEAEVKTKVPEKETVEDAPAMEGKTEKKKIADKFMNYSEMKIFDNLRDNAYSLQDIKRMIREGEITSQMIEKFLSRVEKMEDRVQGKKETMIEGFSGSKYASAYFN